MVEQHQTRDRGEYRGEQEHENNAQHEAAPLTTPFHRTAQRPPPHVALAPRRDHCPYQAVSQPCIWAISFCWSLMIEDASVLISGCCPWTSASFAASTALW